jgi:RNA polymerase sigma factor (sigma-70 family)
MRQDRQTLPDTALITACIQGDALAWDALLQRYSALIYSVARRVGLSPMDADDVFQNVAIVLLEHLPKLRQGDALPGWLMTVTRREAMRWQRRQHTYASLPEAETLPDMQTPEREFLALSDRNLIEQGVARLKERCQHLITALYLTEPPLTYEELTHALGLPLGSIGPNRARCLERLRSELEGLGF